MDLKYQFMRQGDAGPHVRLLQLKLEQLSFTPGPIDGCFGPQTWEALTEFQQSYGLNPDGLVNKRTIQALNDATRDHKESYPWEELTYPEGGTGRSDILGDRVDEYDIIERGSGGEDVVQLQEDLAALGYPVDITGNFDELTAGALKDFQQAHGLQQTGFADRETFEMLSHAKALKDAS